MLKYVLQKHNIDNYLNICTKWLSMSVLVKCHCDILTLSRTSKAHTCRIEMAIISNYVNHDFKEPDSVSKS